MSAMTPVRYAERYLYLPVPLEVGSATVRIDQYRLRHPDPPAGQPDPDPEKEKLWTALKTHFQKSKQQNPGYTLRVRVNDESADFSNPQEMLFRVVSPFWGKGSPEDCQIALQLAVKFGLATKAGLQVYCDSYLGLDCNGFVGNYLFRIVKKNGWRADAAQGAVGPAATITEIMSKAGGIVIHTVDDLVPRRLYVLAEVDGAHQIMAGGPKSAPGHIVITEPNRYMESYMSMDLQLANSGVLGKPAFWGVESTGGDGLSQSWYVIQQLMNGSRAVDGVFRVYRGVKRQYLNFRIIALV